MKPAFTADILAEITRELQPLIGGRIQRISQPQPMQFVLSIFKSGIGEKHLLIDVSARFSRAHLITKRKTSQPQKQPQNLVSEPPVFCRTARKYLDGGRITQITQREGDRILDLKIESEGERFLLSAELMGKHANLILISSSNVILHALKLITSRQSRVREVLPGQKYLSPPTRPFKQAFSKTESKPITSQVLEEEFSRAQLEDEFLQQKSTLLGQLKKVFKQKSYTLQQLKKGTKESARADEFQKFGELILAQLHAVSPRAQSAELIDYYADDALPISIPLDETLTASENAQKYFGRARRLRERKEELDRLERQTQSQVDSLKALIEQVEGVVPSSDAIEELQEFRESAQSQNWLREQTSLSAKKVSGSALKSAFDGYKIKRLTSPDGYELLLGENATSNDALVTRFSHSNDWWLHLRGGTSSHAIIRTNNAPDRVPQSTLLFAAEQVVARSVAKHAGWAEVDYTLRKYVRKPRKSAPGSVVITHQKTLALRKTN